MPGVMIGAAGRDAQRPTTSSHTHPARHPGSKSPSPRVISESPDEASTQAIGAVLRSESSASRSA